MESRPTKRISTDNCDVASTKQLIYGYKPTTVINNLFYFGIDVRFQSFFAEVKRTKYHLCV